MNREKLHKRFQIIRTFHKTVVARKRSLIPVFITSRIRRRHAQRQRQIGLHLPSYQVFISLRFAEAREEANALKTALEARGISTFLCAVQPGGDIAREIVHALHGCKLAIIMGTRTYGRDTGVGYSTFEELRYIHEQKKPFFLVKMCRRFEQEETIFRLGSSISYFEWLSGPMPEDLVTQITEKLHRIPGNPQTTAYPRRKWFPFLSFVITICLLCFVRETYIASNPSKLPLPSLLSITPFRETSNSLWNTFVKPFRFKTVAYAEGLYEGELKDGKKHGKGKMIYTNDDVYDGEWHLGKRQGKGKQTFGIGGSYDGQWKDGKITGNGTVVHVDGDVYEGELKDGEKHGQGKMIYTNDVVYDGEWYLGKQHGKGKVTFAKGGSYEGELKDGKANGNGTVVHDDGAVYEGELVDGKKHGKGKVLFTNGDVYDGEWKDGKKHGNGIAIFADDCVYDGEWKNDVFDGKGKYTFATGSYEGVFKEGKMHGGGKVVLRDGKGYEGEFNDGKMHGKGELLFTNDDVYERMASW
jgi:hypothetical protein